MKLLLYKTLWGFEGGLAEAAAELTRYSYDGLEGPYREDLGELLTSGEYIGEVMTGGDYAPKERFDFTRHRDDLRKGIERCLQGSPRLINVLGGCDWWEFGEKVRFAEALIGMEAEYEVPLSLETHRSRMTFHPWGTRDLMRELPELWFTCDFSHWCCVCERLVMDEEPELLRAMAQRCRHLHARVGYDQGPQVPDPRLARYAAELAAHEGWWKVLWEAAAARGQAGFTVTPEFGPDGYLHEDPATGEAVGDLAEINGWMAGRWRGAEGRP